MRRAAFGLGLLALLGAPGVGLADWPYLTEEASTLGPGRSNLAAGVTRTLQKTDHQRGGKGVLWTYPGLEGTLGVGPHAEVSFQYELLWFDPADGASGRYDSGDLRLWTKLGVAPSWVDGLAVLFGVKLPNASDDRALGTDETDVFLGALYGFGLGPARADLNLGVGILGDPRRPGAQNDLLTWGGSLRTPVGKGVEAGVDLVGRADPLHWNHTRDYVILSGVLGWRRGAWLASLAVRQGYAAYEGWGWALGLTWEP
ncbi:MAG: hypothetical protein ACYDA8_19815 [Deferrisomatales bacterium]